VLQRPSSPWASLNRVSRRPRNKLELLHAPNFCLPSCTCTACRVGASTERSRSRRQAGQAGLCRALVRSDPPPFGRERTHGARLRNSSRWFSWAVRRLTFGACTACRVGASTERSRSSSYRVRAGSKGREKETEKRLDHRTSAFEKTICHNQRYAYDGLPLSPNQRKWIYFHGAATGQKAVIPEMSASHMSSAFRYSTES
jgi:hypothetical protein